MKFCPLILSCAYFNCFVAYLACTTLLSWVICLTVSIIGWLTTLASCVSTASTYLPKSAGRGILVSACRLAEPSGKHTLKASGCGQGIESSPARWRQRQSPHPILENRTLSSNAPRGACEYVAWCSFVELTRVANELPEDIANDRDTLKRDHGFEYRVNVTMVAIETHHFNGWMATMTKSPTPHMEGADAEGAKTLSSIWNNIFAVKPDSEGNKGDHGHNVSNADALVED
ncbi:hypothetical protein FNV43_RR12462 [Rhamnella rubrinervis]|uniref:Uncharacterized protein n=1 Tax=Rhamnella rubrinervis TaxID=2594499 RepID=A0A8K0H7P4_9ROSA|nr:hypothetical protein FNV43_RR12462 [Rhamnella rubrinervis]